MIKDLVLKNRSYRRFDQSFKIDTKTLEELVDLARLGGSAANLQPLKYYLSGNEKTNAIIFEQLSWAGYLKEWGGPKEGERPSAYIVVLGDLDIARNFGCDHGIACQSILLGAVEKGLGGCIVGNIHKEPLRLALNLNSNLEVLLAIALGKPVEQVVVDDIAKDASIKYWRDEKNIHHVPKRTLEDIIVI